MIRENREGCALLTVETDVNGDLRSTNERMLSWLVRWARSAGTRDFCPGLDAVVGPGYKIYFSSSYTISVHLSPFTQQAGQQSCWLPVS
jgi:hypothetical protein